MREVCLWILAIIVVCPIHSTVARVSGRPIDVVPSDLLLILVPLAYPFLKSRWPKSPGKSVTSAIGRFSFTPALALACIIYMAAVVVLGLAFSGEMIRLLSALKLAKPIGFIFLGLILTSWTDLIKLIGLFSRAYAVVVGTVVMFTLADPNFPTCEWGKYFLNFEVSGYPNSSMTFFAVLVPLLIAASDSCNRRSFQWIGRGLAAVSAVMVIGSLSRTSTLALFFSTAIYLAMTGRWKFLIGSAVAFSFLSVVGLGIVGASKKAEIVSRPSDRIQDRIVKSDEQYDPSNGRFEIWQFVLELAKERPVFGYLFEPLSRHAGDVETAHQQYIEILYKCGGVGLLLYFLLLFSCLMDTRRLLSLTQRGSVAWFQLHAIAGMLVGVTLGNLTQSNLTFSLTGNIVFLIFGCLCGSRAAVAVSGTVQTPQIPRSLDAERIAA